MTTDITERIRGFIVSNFLFDDASAILPDDSSLLDRGIIDSTGVLELIMFVEEEFGVEVRDEDVVPENFDSVAGLTSYTLARLSDQQN
jgi:acyl carrier protein